VVFFGLMLWMSRPAAGNEEVMRLGRGSGQWPMQRKNYWATGYSNVFGLDD